MSNSTREKAPISKADRAMLRSRLRDLEGAAKMQNNRFKEIRQAELNIGLLADGILASVGGSDFLCVMDAAITKLGIDLSSQRARAARDKIKREPKVAADALATMVKHERHAREMWVETALEPWCKRHDITLKQGLSILFDDSAFNPVTRNDDLPTREKVFSWSGQQNDFAAYVKMEIEAGARSTTPA